MQGFAGGSAKALGLVAGKRLARAVPDDSVTKHKSSDDDELNESAATVQRPLPPARAVDDNPFAAFENDRVDEDGSLPTEALVRPDVKLDDAGGDPEDRLPTAIGEKKIRPPEPATPQASAPIKTPLAMSVSNDDEPRMTLSLPPEPRGSAPPPESGKTRVAMVQMPHPKQLATASLRAAFQPPMGALPHPTPGLAAKAKTLPLPPHRLALVVSMFLLAAALFIVFRRSQQANAMAAAAPPPADAFPPAAVLPVEVATAPAPIAPTPVVIAASVPVATSRAPAPLAAATAPVQAQPQPRARRQLRAAVRPTIPLHREQ